MSSRALFVEQECRAFLSSAVILMDGMMAIGAGLQQNAEGQYH